MKRELFIDQIRIDGQTQAREKLSEETVTEYAEAKDLPAVTVFHDGTDYWLADGFHRVMAAVKSQKKNITADVKHGTKFEAAWYACGANVSHGLRRTNGDKRKAVKMAMELEGGKSAREIAEHCGVSHTFVLACKAQVATVATSNAETPTKAHNPPPSRPPPGAPPPGKPPAPMDPPPAPRVTGKDGKSYPAKQAASRVKDKEGRYVPDELLSLWARRQKAQDILTAISRIKGILKKAQESKDKLFRAVNFNSTLILCKNLYSEVQEARPYAVCPACQGLVGCKWCCETGLVSESRWKRIPGELRSEIARIVKEQK